MIRYMSAGESHGKSVCVIVEGFPAGLKVSGEYINVQLARRQQGYGRGNRMKIEKDKVDISSGVRYGETIGSPVCLKVVNRDWENRKKEMSVYEKDRSPEFVKTRPRPGHADLAGVLKYNRFDISDILERASARETAARVAAGAVARKFLSELNIDILSYTKQIGEVRAAGFSFNCKEIMERIESSPLRCPDEEAESKMMEEIKKASSEGDTLGGDFCVAACGVPPGFGSHIQWDRKLDGRIAGAMMSVQGIKGVEIGGGFELASLRGSRVHDEIAYDKEKKSFYRHSNRAGGVEGGMSNGENIVVNAAMKPISSLKKPLKSVDIKTKRKKDSQVIRSDVCAVPAASIVGEAVMAMELAGLVLEKTGGDSMVEVKRNYSAYIQQLSDF